ncbi:hypothetical protein LTR28_013718 [Elasticomyces elasticus]|nr:hypothetical protein LTR28_013718 [Elasticomyces elasticus]
MSAKSTGANGTPNGDSTKNRAHHDGSSGRAFTAEQKMAVTRVRKCGSTAFYDILGLEEVKTTCTDTEIKRSYRKLSLLTHPDKNGYEGADEAFKMVSRAFQVLSDPDKKSKFDKFGGDPDNRFGGGASAAASSPFSGFARSASGAGRGGGMWEEEISPEEMFRQFFGGGMGGAFGLFQYSILQLTEDLTVSQAVACSTQAQTSSSTSTAAALAFASINSAAIDLDGDHTTTKMQMHPRHHSHRLSPLSCPS